ncbi:MAG TPA: tetratricopeptide repeat protein [Candidatus Obscuribacterales bacterium]
MNDTWKQTVEAGNEAYANGRVAQAEVHFLDALKEAESFGENDARLALSLNNLAAVYHTQGKYTMAEPLYTRSLEIKKRNLGEEHPDVALNEHNLAILYSARRMYPIAEKHYKRAIDLKSKIYGDKHPELLGTLRYYAQLLKLLNRPVEMKLLEARIKEIEEKN